jgi:ribosomal protein S18 acetylase RimI-like enzyme/glycosyltransferase involved in cell wall biosynthesis
VSLIKQKLKSLYYGFLGKDHEAVVVTFLSGDPERARAMFDEIRKLIPERRHYAVAPEGVSVENAIPFHSYRRLRKALRRMRIGLAPVLFDRDPRYTPMRRAAFLLAPTRILAYNDRLERHHLRLRTLIASLLFWQGVALDRIFLRPWWLFPFKRDRSVVPDTHESFEGRPLSSERPRVAILSPYFPYPLSHGGAVRIFNLLREVSREFDIFLFAFSQNEKREDLAPVLELCAKVILVPAPRYREPKWSSFVPPEVCEFRSPAMTRVLANARREYSIELLQVEYTQLAAYEGDVLVEHDVTFDLFAQVNQRERSLSSWWNLRRWQRFERRALRRYRAVVAMSDKDAKLLGVPRVSIIPNGVDLERFRPVAEYPGERLLFVGSFRHFPNILALRFFIEEVWPRVLDRFPNAKLDVVAGPDPLLYWRAHTGIQQLPAHPSIHIEGFVADVRPHYGTAKLVIVPTTVSAGTNLKVLEAMAMERAVVSTTSGCAGLGLEHGHTVWIGETAQEFASGVVALLGDSSLRVKIAAAGRAHVQRSYGWNRLGNLQIELWRRLLGLPSIRAASIADVAQLEHIQAETGEAAQWETERYLDYDCHVAVNGDRILGFVVSRQTGSREREILNLGVARNFRRQGIATKLLNHEFRMWPGAFFLEVRESNLGAQSLYRKLGFVEIGRRLNYYDRPPETAIVMRFQSC